MKFTLSALLATAALAQSNTCNSGYTDLPGFPAANSGCYPTSYYQTFDLGTQGTDPATAKTRCHNYCSADASCAAYVAQVNKAADSNTYSGTCFLYHANGVPTGPRQCADKAYLLIGQRKDGVPACFSSSSKVASKYCSSVLGYTESTKTKLVMATTTQTSTPLSIILSNVTTSTTTTVGPTTPLTLTTTTSSTLTSTVSTITITAPPAPTMTTTTTVTVTATSTSTMTNIPNCAKRFAKRAAKTSPAPACLSTQSASPSQIRSDCSCFVKKPGTTTTTSTSTSTVVISQTTSTTTGATVIITITSPASLPVPTVTSTVTSTSTTTVTTASGFVFTALASPNVWPVAQQGSIYFRAGLGGDVGVAPCTLNTDTTVTCSTGGALSVIINGPGQVSVAGLDYSVNLSCQINSLTFQLTCTATDPSGNVRNTFYTDDNGTLYFNTATGLTAAGGYNLDPLFVELPPTST